MTTFVLPLIISFRTLGNPTFNLMNKSFCLQEEQTLIVVVVVVITFKEYDTECIDI
jgi:hypothetical protein